MWIVLAFVSAALLGFYDVAKKQALRNNAVPVVLLLNTLFSTILFSPFIISTASGAGWFKGTMFEVAQGSWHDHLLVVIKSAIVLSSWIFGYIGIKHLPITIVGPINATRPVLVLLGALLIFGERLNGMQWIGVSLAIVSVFLLSRAGRKEGIDFKHNKWIYSIAAAAVMGAVSGLYDRYIMRELEPVFVQSWYNLYQFLMMGAAVVVLRAVQGRGVAFHWSWAIPMISILLSAADLAYLVALSNEDAMISVVSMVRRSSVVVSFLCGAMLFKEGNLRAKALDLLLILIGMVFLYLGTR
ncbi:MAG: EamA family transporter [Alistipes sp.]|nr:EamA family transporter [Alistipes sp.]